MQMLLHLPYSNAVGLIVGCLDTTFGLPRCRFGLLGRRFWWLVCSWVICEISKIVHYLFKHKDTHASLYGYA